MRFSATNLKGWLPINESDSAVFMRLPRFVWKSSYDVTEGGLTKRADWCGFVWISLVILRQAYAGNYMPAARCASTVTVQISGASTRDCACGLPEWLSIFP
jgi:hypothetical protein